VRVGRQRSFIAKNVLQLPARKHFGRTEGLAEP
jgi:hypothetical protein